ncbi:OmpA family protein [Spirosoma aerophilum]
MTGSTWWHVCKIKQLCGNDPLPVAASDSAESTTLAEGEGFTIADSSLFRLDFPGNFSFAKSGANANMNTLGGSLDALITYLKANPERRVEVNGFYSSTETNATSFPNLGLARAEGIKQYMVQQGIPAASLRTKGEERNLSFNTAKGDSLYGGIYFAFTGATADAQVADTVTAPAPMTIAEATTEKQLAETQKFTSVFKPIDLYFPLGGANYIKTEETKKFFDEATAYLSAHKDKKLLLTGYTDNSGPDDVNLRLSRDRANQVKSKLRRSGISDDQIVVSAKGEEEPKADNSTLSGRKANRRVTVVVQ